MREGNAMHRDTLPNLMMPTLALPPEASELACRMKARCVVCGVKRKAVICPACFWRVGLLLTPPKAEQRLVLERATKISNPNVLWLAYYNARGDWRRAMLYRLANKAGHPAWHATNPGRILCHA